jgi:hypothetical protein
MYWDVNTSKKYLIHPNTSQYIPIHPVHPPQFANVGVGGVSVGGGVDVGCVGDGVILVLKLALDDLGLGATAGA